MFRNAYQSGLLSVFFSGGSNPLSLWDLEVHNGHIKRLTDQEVHSVVLEVVSTNVATTYMSCPKDKQVLGIRLPFLVMILKNLQRYFSFEVTILDDKNMRRRFRISNFQSCTKIKPFCTTMPICLAYGWNQIQFNLADFTRRAYGSQFMETLRLQVHANVRLRRIYFSDRLYTEEELPQDYKLYLPLEKKKKKGIKEFRHLKSSHSRIAAHASAAPKPPPEPVPEAEAEAQPDSEQPTEEPKPPPPPAQPEAGAEAAPPADEATPAEMAAEAPAETPAEEAADTPAAESEAPAETVAPAESEPPPEAPVE